MRKKYMFAAALIAVLVFSGCVLGMNGGDGGSVSLSFSVAPGAKLTAGPEDEYFEVRVWVYSGNRLVPGPSGSYHAARIQPYSTGVIKIGNLPPGNNYRIAVGAGWGWGSEPVIIDSYAASGVFSVAAGAETAVPVGLGDIYVFTAFTGAGDSAYPLDGVKSVVITNPEGPLYSAATATTVHTAWSFNEYDNTFSPDYTLEGETLNSLSLGLDGVYEVVLMNSSEGISQYGDSVAYWGESSAPNVLQSTVLDSFYLYRTADEFGGFEPNEGSNPWVRIPLGSRSRRVFDFAIAERSNPYEPTFSDGIVATNFVGTFIVNSYFFNPENTIEDRLAVLLDPIARVDAGIRLFSEDPNWGSGKPQIQAFGFDTEGSLFIGTANGLYSATVTWEGADSSTPIVSDVLLVPGTQGLSITKIAGGDSGRVAFIASSQVMLTSYYGEVFPLPFLSDLVGTVSDIAFDYIAGYGPYAALVIGGNGGLVRLTGETIFSMPW